MKLDELSSQKHTQVAQVFESFFEQSLSVQKLNAHQTRNILIQVDKLLEAVRTSNYVYHSQNSPAYLKLVMLKESLSDHWHGLSKNTNTTLFEESEVAHAQVILAAQDMIDQVQGMLEDASELQFKELPALVDSIRNQIGSDQSNQFNTDATSALTLLVQNLQNAKQQLDTALGVLTGQAMPSMTALPAPGDEMNTSPMMGTDLPPPELDDGDIENSEPEPSLKGPNLGRERR
jgi:hypothetical protein